MPVGGAATHAWSRMHACLADTSLAVGCTTQERQVCITKLALSGVSPWPSIVRMACTARRETCKRVGRTFVCVRRVTREGAGLAECVASHTAAGWTRRALAGREVSTAHCCAGCLPSMCGDVCVLACMWLFFGGASIALRIQRMCCTSTAAHSCEVGLAPLKCTTTETIDVYSISSSGVCWLCARLQRQSLTVSRV